MSSTFHMQSVDNPCGVRRQRPTGSTRYRRRKDTLRPVGPLRPGDPVRLHRALNRGPSRHGGARRLRDAGAGAGSIPADVGCRSAREMRRRSPSIGACCSVSRASPRLPGAPILRQARVDAPASGPRRRRKDLAPRTVASGFGRAPDDRHRQRGHVRHGVLEPRPGPVRRRRPSRRSPSARPPPGRTRRARSRWRGSSAPCRRSSRAG